jgi:S-adenosylmethionine hydrolase
MSPPVVALLTDFGTRDWYVAAIRGVILSRCPRVRLLDVTHEIPPQDVVSGAFTLAAAAPWFPRGTVFVAVVDPGVGGPRALLAARADSRYFIGPDNGLLAQALARARRCRVVRLTNRRYWLTDVSPTFHGRDIMAPVAAYLAAGGSLGRLGIPLSRVLPLDLPTPQRRGRRLAGRIIHIDGFGNLITNLPASALESGGRLAGPTVRYQRRPVRVVSSYGEGRARELIALANSQGVIELAVHAGSAARMFNARRGDCVDVGG